MTSNAWFFGFGIGIIVSLFLVLILTKRRKAHAESLSGTIHEMTSTLKTQVAELAEEQAKISAILEQMAEGVIAVDSRKRILLMNRSAESIFDVSRQKSLGRSILEIVRNPKVDQIIDRAILKKEAVAEEIEVFHPDRKVLKANAVGAQTQDSQVAGILVLSDITDLRKLERLRQEFVANVSHELKTPLTSIKGFIETLLGGALESPGKARSFLKMMEEDTERLTRLIGDLFELSKVEAKEITLKLEELDLKSEVEKVLLGFSALTQEKKIAVENNLDCRVAADRDRLKQILINLIENAIKFNKVGGKIIFRSRPVSTGIEISIEDTGIGIPEGMIPRIFERFFRVDQARFRELGGTGLGLSIVKHLVESHGGRVRCESKPNVGSKFFFTLPVLSS
ncbi:MAG: PAS domain-containing protein [Candidatus Omnitrophica bacterium]|nr:PAS domain-containing protein [Candidatus Omnitrophota bacterium]